MVVEFLTGFLVILIKVVVAWTKAIVHFFLPTSLIGKDIKGQTVLITGAGGGIGSLLACRFAALGCDLVLWDVDPGLNEKTAAEARKTGVKVTTNTVDLTDREAIYSTADKVEREVGKVNIVVNNAGIITGKKVMDSSDKAMELTMKVNAMAHFWMAKAFLNQMMKRNEGHIVSMASSAGLFGVGGMADYCSSKFAAVGFEESLRMELNRRPDNEIRTTIVCPYLIRTPMFTGCKAKYPLIMDSLEPEYVADKMVDAILRNQEFLCLPRQLYILAAMKMILPTTVQLLLNDFFGVTDFMDPFVGRKKEG